MALYTTEQKIFIVDKIARCHPVREIVDLFRERWSDTVCTEQTIFAHDPTRGAVLPPEVFAAWQEIKEYVDKNWRKEAPTTSRGIRLLHLHREFEWKRSRNIFDAELLAQIADELKDDKGGDLSDVPTEFERVIVDHKPDANT